MQRSGKNDFIDRSGTWIKSSVEQEKSKMIRKSVVLCGKDYFFFAAFFAGFFAAAFFAGFLAAAFFAAAIRDPPPTGKGYIFSQSAN
jgi:hypothetical protein